MNVTLKQFTMQTNRMQLLVGICSEIYQKDRQEALSLAQSYRNRPQMKNAHLEAHIIDTH